MKLEPQDATQKGPSPDSPPSGTLPVAAVWRRMAALLFDVLFLIVVALLYFALRGGLFLRRFAGAVEYDDAEILGHLAKNELISSLSAAILIGIFYFVVLEWVWLRGTLGKIVFSVRVTSLDLKNPTLRQVAVRFVAKFCFGALTLGLSWLAALHSSKRQAWHDRLAETLVVKTNAPAPLTDPPEISS